jgi:ABC-type microcin C transport system permease subunit YejB
VGTTSYFIRRLFLIIPTFIGITLLVFAVTRVVPGGPIERMLNQALIAGGERGGPQRGVAGNVLSDQQLDQLRDYYGFDKPMLVSSSVGSATCSLDLRLRATRTGDAQTFPLSTCTSPHV